MSFFVYILASKRNGTLYIGLTNDLARRLSAHKAKLVPGFTKQYDVTLLVISKPSSRYSKLARANIR